LTPLFAPLAAIPRAADESGELAGRIPFGQSLTQQYGGAAGTAERALAILRAEGIDPPAMGPRHFVVSYPSLSAA